jgi:type VI secretion system protein ImpC
MTAPPPAVPHRRAITYPFEAEGVAQDRELPFRVGVVADLAGDAEAPPLAERTFLPVGEDGIAGAMARLKPGFRHALGEPAEGRSVMLALRSMADFDPPGLARQLAAAGLAQPEREAERVSRSERFRRLEAAWRGLDLITAQAGQDPAISVCLLPVSRAELAAALAQGLLHRLLSTDVETRRGADPFALLVGDQAWTEAAEDIETLRLAAGIAAAAFVPYLSVACGSLCDLGFRRFGEPSPDAALAAWRALRDSDTSRFLVLTTAQFADAVPGPFRVAARLVDAFRRDGVCADLPGAEPLRLGQPEQPLARHGFLPVAQRPGSPLPALVGSMTVQRPRLYEREEATLNAEIAATLPYVMVTSRIAHYLKAMARDRIGAWAEARDLEPWLAGWLSGLATSGRDRRPLYQGRVEVREVPGEPGRFDAVCFLRPWLAAAELTTELRLIVRLPRAC